MEDRDGKKPFIIPKTNISNKGINKFLFLIKYFINYLLKMSLYQKKLIVEMQLNYLMILNHVHLKHILIFDKMNGNLVIQYVI
jgi:hypothetical protein